MSANRMGYLPNEQPPLLQNILLGFQHVLTMFPATIFVAAFTGFHVGTVLLASGVSTIVALLLSKRSIGKFIPLFYGSSFSYIAAYLAVVVQMTGELPAFGVPVPDEVLSTMLQEAFQDLHAFRAFQINSYTTLIAVGRNKVGGHPGFGKRWSPLPRVVAAARCLNFDDVCP